MKFVKILIILLSSVLFLMLIACPPPAGEEEQPTPVGEEPTDPPTGPTATPTQPPPPPPGQAYPPVGAKYVYRDVTTGYKGTVVIEKAEDETDVANYNLYWGTGPGEKESSEPFQQEPPTGAGMIYAEITVDTVVPAGVNYILVTSENAAGEESETLLNVAFSPNIALTLLSDFNPGPGNSIPKEMCEYNGTLYFSAYNDTEGRELAYYVDGDGSSGRPSGADLVEGGGADDENGNPSGMIVFNDKLYFNANDETSGTELHSMDSGETIVCVSDINPTGPSDPQWLTIMTTEDPNDKKLFFTAKDDTGVIELYSCSILDNITNINDNHTGTVNFHTPRELVMRGSTLYFVGTNADPTPSPPPTQPININNIYTLPEYEDVVGAVSHIGQWTFQPEYLTVFNDNLFFKQNNPLSSGLKLWVWDFNVSEAITPALPFVSLDSEPSGLFPYNGMLYYSGIGEISGLNIGREFSFYSPGDFYYQGIDLNPLGDSSNPEDMIGYMDMLFFNATGSDGETELWVFDPESAQVAQLDLNRTGGSNPTGMTYYSAMNGLCFAADTGDGNGIELYGLTYAP